MQYWRCTTLGGGARGRRPDRRAASRDPADLRWRLGDRSGVPGGVYAPATTRGSTGPRTPPIGARRFGIGADFG